MGKDNSTPDRIQAVWNKLGGEAGIDALLAGDSEVVTAKLLQEVGVVTIHATTSTFVAKDKFRLKKDGGIFSYIGGDFQSWYGDKVEAPITEKNLRYAKLRKTSSDGQIIDELGGEAKAETTLTELFSLMEKQEHGEDGALLTNGWDNIFFIKDGAGVLHTVHVYLNDDGWRVDADSVESLDGWSHHCQVFSCNSGSLEPPARKTDMVQPGGLTSTQVA